MVPPTATPQTVPTPPRQQNNEELPVARPELEATVWQWQGIRVDKIEFVGVTFDADDFKRYPDIEVLHPQQIVSG